MADTAMGLGWLPDGSPVSVRAGLCAVVPGLGDREIVLNDRVVASDPRFFQGSAVIGGEYVVKFAWSEPAARRLVHEAHILDALGPTDRLRLAEQLAVFLAVLHEQPVGRPGRGHRASIP